MINQKEIVHKIYIDLVNESDWIYKYREDPKAILDSYGLNEENRNLMQKILALF